MKPGMMMCSLTLLLASAAAFADGYPMRSSSDAVSEHDLKAIAYASGIQFARYDYEVPVDHCIDFRVETQVADEPVQEASSGHVCDRAGPHRLLILWQRASGELTFSMFLRRLDEDSGYNSTEGQPIDIPVRGGLSGGALHPPVLEIGRAAALVDVDYWISEPDGTGSHYYSYYKRIRLLAVLRSNPEGVIGSGGGESPVSPRFP